MCIFFKKVVGGIGGGAPVAPPVFVIVFYAVVFSIVAFVLRPLLIVAGTSVLLNDAPLPTILSVVYRLYSVLIFSVYCSLVSFTTIAEDTGDSLELFNVCTTTYALEHNLILTVSFIVCSSISALSLLDMNSTLTFRYVLTLVVAVVSICMDDGSGTTHMASNVRDAGTFGFSGMFSGSGPLLVYALVSAIVVTVAHVSVEVVSSVSCNTPADLKRVLVVIITCVFSVLLSTLFCSVT